MKKYINYLLALVLVLVFVGCNKKPVDNVVNDNEFLKQTVEGIYGSKDAIFVFDKEKHQLAANPIEKKFRIQTDIQDEYINMTLSAIPVATDTEVEVNIKSSGIDNLLSRYSTKTLKIEDGRVWLWDDKTSVGFIIKTEL